MLNEIEEFKAYTTFPIYEAKNKYDASYLGRFTYEMLLGQIGFSRVLTILARGYMWEQNEPNVDRAQRALLAWCSLPETKSARPKKDGHSETCYVELHGEFPELVDEHGAGWLYRHVQNIVVFAKQHPEKLSNAALANCEKLKTGFTKAWRNKFLQYQVPPFTATSTGSWLTGIDDALAEAKEQGALKKLDYDLSPEEAARLLALTPKGVPANVLPTLVKYYFTHKPEDSDWVVLPVTNFDAYFGTTSFSRRWLQKLPECVIVRERDGHYGVCRYRIF